MRRLASVVHRHRRTNHRASRQAVVLLVASTLASPRVDTEVDSPRPTNHQATRHRVLLVVVLTVSSLLLMPTETEALIKANSVTSSVRRSSGCDSMTSFIVLGQNLGGAGGGGASSYESSSFSSSSAAY